MRLLLVDHTGSVSGAERSLLALIDGLHGRGVDCVLACPGDGPLRQMARQRGARTLPIAGTDGSLRLHPVHTPVALSEIGLAVAQVAGHARRINADVIHANSIRASMLAGPAGQLGGRASVAHLRDRLPVGAAANASLRIVAATCTEIVANSRYTADGLSEAGVRRSATVVPNPVDLNAFRPLNGRDRRLMREQLKLSSGTFALGVVGQITPWKGQEAALLLLAQLASDHPGVHLLVVGEAKFVSAATRYDNREYLAGLHALADGPMLRGRVTFLGEREDVPQIMSALDTVLVPSWEEPFGRVVVEAMAAGTPVVATDVGGPTETIEDGVSGLLVPPRDVEAWARVVERVMADPGLRTALVEGGRRRSAAFGIAAHADAMLEVYRSAIERAAARRRP